MTSSFLQMTDSDLFQCMAKEDMRQGAFEALYQRYHTRIYRYCERMLQDSDDAADAFQDAWIQIHAVGCRPRPAIENLRGYLFATARNVCLMKIRSAQSRVVLVDDLWLAQSDDASMGLAELQELLNKALDVLDIEYREAYVLHEIEGFSYEEVSEITGASVHALRNRVWRTRTHVRTYLSPLVDRPL